MKKYIIFLFILLALIVPISFANDNSTYDDSYVSVNEDGNISTSNVIYFNSTVEFDGNGSQSSPYKYFSNSKVKDNSILYFADGDYSLSQGFSFSNLTIIGNDPLKTIINGNDKVITSKNSLYISNLTLNFLSIKNSNKLTLNNVIFQNSNGVVKSYDNVCGGAIYISGSGNTLIQSSTFKNNNATYGGAIYASEKNNLTIINSTFENNQAYKYGGAIAVENGANLEIIGSTFTDCYSVSNAGGAIYARDSTLNVEKSNFTSCNATFGGAICDLKSNSTIYSIIANNNIANYEGGAIYKMYGTMEIKSSSFLSNEASNGGAVFIDNASSISIYSSSFSDNLAKYCGGAIYTVLNTNESMNSINFKNNKAETENNYYKAKGYNLFIGNGNYTLIKGSFEFNGTLPSKYDLRDFGWVTPVKSQKSSGNCWAFTSIAALESCILKATNQTYDFSEENMKNVMAYYSDYGWNLETNKGGYDDMGVGYLVSWLGAMSEGFETFSDLSVLSPVLNSSIHVQNLIYLTRTNYTDNDAIKEAIVKYGAVATGIYYSSSYNKANNYYYSGNMGQNHAVTIVGWDDNYSKDKFRTAPEGDGAWICKNSWGDTWGDKGYFYVSYYDTRCVKLGESQKSTYTFILNDTNRYEKNYQYDIIGITDYFITGKDTIWYENIFNATNNEYLKAFSTYFNSTTNWTAEIYVNNDLKLVKSGVSAPGYYTFDLDKQIPLKIGDTFKIVIKIFADKYASFPISEKVRSNRVLYSNGVSFFSYDGKEWFDLYDYELNMSEFGHTYKSQVACIKAFTSYNTLNTTISVFNNNQVISINAPFNLTAVVKDQYGGIVNNGQVKFTIDSKSYTVPISNGAATLTAKLDSVGIYNVKAEYLKNLNYLYSSTSQDINVSISKANLSLAIPSIYYGENLLIKNNLSSNGIVLSGDVNVNINFKSYSVKSNTVTNISDIFNPGKYTAYATYYNIGNATATFNVYKIPISMTLTIKNTDVDAVDIIVKLSQSINASVNVNVNSKAYSLKTVNGQGILSLNDLDYGNYSVNAKFVNAFYENATAGGKFSINSIKTHLLAENVTMYYRDGTRFYVSLVDKNNNPMFNESVIFYINGMRYQKYTDDKGTCSLPLQLNSATYQINISYFGNGKYLADNLTRTVLIKPTIISSDITKIFRNATPFTAKIIDKNGNPVKNTVVTMNINGVFYYKTTDNEGVARLNLNLAQGNYTLTTNNPITGENAANNVNIIPSIVENNNLVLYYKNGSKYSVKLLSSTGSPLPNTNVTFNINGVFYNRLTDSNGKAFLTINLNPATYIITAEYNGCRVSNKIVVLPVIESNDLSMKYKDGSQFKVRILDGFGKAYPSQKVVYNVNGIFYTKYTDENGIAALTINLQAGKYIITSSYNGLNAANTITISS